jgi:hypothetical protein
MGYEYRIDGNRRSQEQYQRLIESFATNIESGDGLFIESRQPYPAAAMVEVGRGYVVFRPFGQGRDSSEEAKCIGHRFMQFLCDIQDF